MSFDYSRDALAEIDPFFRKSGKIIIALTVSEILNEQIARELAEAVSRALLGSGRPQLMDAQPSVERELNGTRRMTALTESRPNARGSG